MLKHHTQDTIIWIITLRILVLDSQTCWGTTVKNWCVQRVILFIFIFITRSVILIITTMPAIFQTCNSTIPQASKPIFTVYEKPTCKKLLDLESQSDTNGTNNSSRRLNVYSWLLFSVAIFIIIVVTIYAIQIVTLDLTDESEQPIDELVIIEVIDPEYVSLPLGDHHKWVMSRQMSKDWQLWELRRREISLSSLEKKASLLSVY